MADKDFNLGDIVVMKKPHPCGTNQWKIIRMGADIRIKCLGCQRSILMPRRKFVNRLKEVVTSESINENIHRGDLLKPNNQFLWPSTHVSESSNTLSDEVVFKDQSELYKYGYRITGLSREERWKVLTEKVLNQMPLEKVVHIIAAHVRNRKRQSNGIVKYAYAIREWEYDLQRLKAEYYKHDFKWPQS
ncbi:protein of unknown function DUF951 [Caldalkalibacillus thermarum TA2.A1]|uniref:DUF951 domain-containing protein n=1 Tax=Caldalkalibacillus thermarum (strain TA2.A1) TaxID=986075 RepID=F5L317_CALTT|nr:protein of unknown function DUF951 [Caldalkalibacillus thermarum TA2.A1]QZT33651.1 DUF951 domain-containing protein [Caldalkalibacillus thermarum TA2.A1]